MLQATGNLATASDFYWPGYVYLGTIASDAQGVAQPGTLGFGQITLGGDLNNVLPGNVDIGGGIHFMTAFPFNMNGHSVTTNANAWVNFATPALTDAYANGVLGSGLFFGGVQQGTGLVVNYGALDPSMFHTHVPNPAR